MPPGVAFHQLTEEIERGVRSSRVTIAVLPSAYIDEPFVTLGKRLAEYASAVEGADRVLLPLLLEDCPFALPHIRRRFTAAPPVCSPRRRRWTSGPRCD